MLSASRPMKKEEIGAVLWPEVTDEVLRLRFKNNMYRLRNATSQNVILYGNELYAFNHELNPSYDLETFRSTLERARRESDIAEQIRHYRTAVDLVRGRYLEDFDSTWVLSERERLEQEYLDALISLARLQFKVGNLSQALTTCRKALAWDNCFEEAHRLMMEIHAASGDRTALARQYQRLAEILMRELGVSPSEETENLYRTLAT
jgi:two-component SAPR family response regulator